MDVGAQVPHAAAALLRDGRAGRRPRRGAHRRRDRRDGRARGRGARGRRARVHHARGPRKHRAADGRFTPSLTAGEPSCSASPRRWASAGRGVLQVQLRLRRPRRARPAPPHGRGVRPAGVVLAPPGRRRTRPLARDCWTASSRRQRDGLPSMRGQVGVPAHRGALRPRGDGPPVPRPPDLPGRRRPAAGRAGRRGCARPEVRDALLAEEPDGGFGAWMDQRAAAETFELGDPPDYEPDPSPTSIAARAAAAGRRRRGALPTTCCWPTRVAPCSTTRSRTTATATSSRRARCCARPHTVCGPRRRRRPRRHDLRRLASRPSC